MRCTWHLSQDKEVCVCLAFHVLPVGVCQQWLFSMVDFAPWHFCCSTAQRHCVLLKDPSNPVDVVWEVEVPVPWWSIRGWHLKCFLKIGVFMLPQNVVQGLRRKGMWHSSLIWGAMSFPLHSSRTFFTLPHSSSFSSLSSGVVMRRWRLALWIGEWKRETDSTITVKQGIFGVLPCHLSALQMSY